MMELSKIKSFLFIDEVKFTRSNKDIDDSFYYFAVAVPKSKFFDVQNEFEFMNSNLPKGFHAKDQYKKKNINTLLLNGITEIFLKNNLLSLCFKYDKARLYEISCKHLPTIKHSELQQKVTNWEFQAFFYFVQTLEYYFRQSETTIEFPVCLFVDRGLYGINDNEDIEINSDYIGRAAFTSNSKIKLLALADHCGY